MTTSAKKIFPKMNPPATANIELAHAGRTFYIYQNILEDMHENGFAEAGFCPNCSNEEREAGHIICRTCFDIPENSWFLVGAIREDLIRVPESTWIKITKAIQNYATRNSIAKGEIATIEKHVNKKIKKPT